MITVITAWYNEEDLSWLFLNHYGDFVDLIVVLLDESTNDRTINQIEKYRATINKVRIEVKPLMMPKGLDDRLKRDQLNQEASCHDDGWIIMVDADEFILEPEEGMAEYLDKVEADCIKIDYIQIYQHKTEKPLNFIDPILLQRRYGKRNGLNRWKKPAIARAGKGLGWSYGHHEINTGNFHHEMIPGMHLSMADVDMAIKRRIYNHRNHMSEENYKAKLSVHNYKITPEEIKKICQENTDCPLMFN